MPILKQRIYGTGQLVAIPATLGVPVVVASLQNVDLTIKGDITELAGPDRIAEDAFLGKLTIEGSYQSGAIRSGLITAALPGASLTTGTMFRSIVQESTGTIAGATYTLSKTTSVVCLGVYDETGALMTPVASVTAAGQYSVTAGGVFTFHSTANGKAFTIDALYLDAAATTGWTANFTNQTQGAATGLTMYLLNKTKGKEFGAKLWSVLLPELSLSLKIGEVALPKGSFKAFADSSARVIDFWGEN